MTKSVELSNCNQCNTLVSKTCLFNRIGIEVIPEENVKDTNINKNKHDLNEFSEN